MHACMQGVAVAGTAAALEDSVELMIEAMARAAEEL